MGKGMVTACFLFFLIFLSTGVFPQEEGQSIPEALRRPDRGETPRYPQDLVIGELGRGQAPEGAYVFARNLLSALTTGNNEAQVLTDTGSVITESMLEELRSLQPRTFRLGGGRFEPDGSVSFLLRFLGPQESISGELYLRQTQEEAPGGTVEIQARWLLDDLLLEERRSLTEIRGSYRFDFSPYERFF
jgi:hypothetical protein